LFATAQKQARGNDYFEHNVQTEPFAKKLLNRIVKAQECDAIKDK